MSQTCHIPNYSRLSVQEPTLPPQARKPGILRNSAIASVFVQAPHLSGLYGTLRQNDYLRATARNSTLQKEKDAVSIDGDMRACLKMCFSFSQPTYPKIHKHRVPLPTMLCYSDGRTNALCVRTVRVIRNTTEEPANVQDTHIDVISQLLPRQHTYYSLRAV